MKKQVTLRNSILIAIILVTAIIVVIQGYVSNWRSAELLTERMIDDYQETTDAVCKNIETLIIYVQDFTKYTALDEGVLNTITDYQNESEENNIRNRMLMKAKWDKISTRVLYSTSMLYSLDVYSGDKLIYSYFDDPSETETKNIPEDVLHKAVAQRQPIWTDLLTLKQTRSYTKAPDYGFGVVKSVVDESMQKVGAISVFVRESSFSDILKPTKEEKKSRFYLVNENNQVISAVDKTELYKSVKLLLNLSESEYKECLEKEVFLKERKGEIPILYLSRKIGDKGVKLICETTMDELGKQRRDLQFFAIILMILSVGMAIISAWYVSKRVTKPLGELMGLMERIKAEDKNNSLRFPEGNTGEIGVLGSRFNELMDQLSESMNQIYREQRERRHNELKLLQSQISPHFLYNTMGVISSFIKLGMPDKALETIQNLVSFYRLSLSSGEEIIHIKEEVEVTRNYMNLQQLRYIEYMDYTIACDKEIEDCWIPKLTIQPLVENVLQHGLRYDEEKCRIHITFSYEKEEDRVKICVHDNGTGMKPDRLAQLRQNLEAGKSVTKSFGIYNVDQRLKLIYGEGYHMEIDSVEGEYTQITMYLPKEKQEGEKDV